MRLVGRIENIKEILKSGNNLFVRGIDIIENNVYIIVDPEYGIFEKCGYIYMYNNGNIKLFNLKSNKFDIEYEDSVSISPSYYNKGHFLLFRKTNKIVQEILNFEIIRNFTLNQPHNFFLGSSFISISGESYTKRNRVACYMIQNDNIPLWEFFLPEQFFIFGKIQVIDNILFFTAFKNANKAQNVYGIDIHSGQIQWELNYSIPYTTYVLASLINSEDNLCYGYGGHFYQVFDPIRGEIILKKDMSEYYNQGIDPILPVNSLSDDKLWFVSGRGEKAKFGALNIKTAEIESIQDYPLENDGQLGKPIYHQGKLYIKDDSNVLHVFE